MAMVAIVWAGIGVPLMVMVYRCCVGCQLLVVGHRSLVVSRGVVLVGVVG